jgi:hypothetical protein
MSLQAPPAAAAAAAAGAASAAATAAAAAAPVLGLVDAQGPSAHVSAIQLVDRLIGVPVIHLHEGEAARAAGLPVGDHRHRMHFSNRGEKIPEVRFGCTPGKVADIDLLHVMLSLTTWDRSRQ